MIQKKLYYKEQSKFSRNKINNYREVVSCIEIEKSWNKKAFF